MILSIILLMAGGQSGQGQTSTFGLLFPLILIFVIMYFFMIRPQVKRQKQHQAMIQSLGKGDKIVTSGGIYGKIVDVKSESFVVQIAEKIKIEVLKTAIAKKLE